MDVFVKGDFDYLDKFINEVMKKYDLRSDPNDVKEMIIEQLREQAIKVRKGNEKVVPTAVSEEAMRNAIIKASSHVKAWKNEKKKKAEEKKISKYAIEELAEEKPAKPTKKIIRKKKVEEESEEEFEQLDLF